MCHRCEWSLGSDIEKKYHDIEWGVPCYDDRMLFEFLILEGAQAGLSWSTILNKRENYRKSFDNFEAEKVALYNEGKKLELLMNKGIVRNRLKIDSAILNAQKFINIKEQEGSFSDFIWGIVDGKPIRNNWKKLSDVPANTSESDRMSKILKKEGFKFVGSTICYAFMQAVGMVNDHTTNCFRHHEIQ